MKGRESGRGRQSLLLAQLQRERSVEWNQSGWRETVRLTGCGNNRKVGRESARPGWQAKAKEKAKAKGESAFGYTVSAASLFQCRRSSSFLFRSFSLRQAALRTHSSSSFGELFSQHQQRRPPPNTISTLMSRREGGGAPVDGTRIGGLPPPARLCFCLSKVEVCFLDLQLSFSSV